MMKIHRYLSAIALPALLTAAFTSGCKKDPDNVTTPPPPTNDSEVITTVQLAFTDTANPSSKLIARFKDPDGDGGLTPTVFDTIRLSASRVYFTEVLLLDETKNPVDTISNEVLEEAEDHHFFFHPAGANITVSYSDKDANNLPIGLKTKWTTGIASSGTVKVVLKHQPGVKNGTEAPGDTDVEINFQARVQ